ncbi:unnamed protein product, partial [Ectocarpus sp. 12 AP-2014]
LPFAPRARRGRCRLVGGERGERARSCHSETLVVYDPVRVAVDGPTGSLPLHVALDGHNPWLRCRKLAHHLLEVFPPEIPDRAVHEPHCCYALMRVVGVSGEQACEPLLDAGLSQRPLIEDISCFRGEEPDVRCTIFEQDGVRNPEPEVRVADEVFHGP